MSNLAIFHPPQQKCHKKSPEMPFPLYDMPNRALLLFHYFKPSLVVTPPIAYQIAICQPIIIFLAWFVKLKEGLRVCI